MARSNIPMVINLRQNKNDESTAFGKWFAEVDAKEPLNLKGFAKHMTSHGKIADYQMCVLVLGQVVDCMTELLAQGQPVKLDGLGTFYPTLQCTKTAGKSDVPTFINADFSDLIAGVHLRFKPIGDDIQKLTAKNFMEQCSFEKNDYVKINQKMVQGVKQTWTERVPLAQWDEYIAGGGSPVPERISE